MTDPSDQRQSFPYSIALSGMSTLPEDREFRKTMRAALPKGEEGKHGTSLFDEKYDQTDGSKNPIVVSRYSLDTHCDGTVMVSGNPLRPVVCESRPQLTVGTKTSRLIPLGHEDHWAVKGRVCIPCVDLPLETFFKKEAFNTFRYGERCDDARKILGSTATLKNLKSFGSAETLIPVESATASHEESAEQASKALQSTFIRYLIDRKDRTIKKGDEWVLAADLDGWSGKTDVLPPEEGLAKVQLYHLSKAEPRTATLIAQGERIPYKGQMECYERLLQSPLVPRG